MTQSYIYECKTYAVNQAKWKAADEWCKDKRIEFKIITEKELGIHHAKISFEFRCCEEQQRKIIEENSEYLSDLNK